MARDKKFVFRLSDDESSRLTRLAELSQRTQSDVIRHLLRTADTQEKTALIARSLAAYAMSAVSFQPPLKEPNNAEFTHTG